MNWRSSVASRKQVPVSALKEVANLLKADAEWSEVATILMSPNRGSRSVHLAIFIDPFLDLLLDGRKTVESRFSAVRFPPYGQVARGDLVILKRSGGPVVGICEIGAAWFYRLDPDSWRTIRLEFTHALCAEQPDFWSSRESAEFATLMYVSRAKRLPPVNWPKRDRRGWVVVHSGRPKAINGGRMKQTVIAFSGAIASGKSTLSEAVALSLGCQRVSFGAYIRYVARTRGLGDSREMLQAIGEELVGRDPEALCRNVLAQVSWLPGEQLVVDGVRHISVVDALERLVSPGHLRLVHLVTPPAKRASRLDARQERGDLTRYDAHTTEHDVHNGLAERADLVVDGARAIESAIEQVTQWAAALP